jgi:glycosyltransferase involved in cell wall biosynthesis
MKFSIIVPVYNAEPFLLKCLNSIFNQKANFDFEVIAINDCSTDKSLQVLKNYAESEKRLIILQHEVNKGQAIARATGMKIAKGEYITHVDADDWILEDAFHNIFLKIEKYNPDVLVLNTFHQISSDKRVEVLQFSKEGFFYKEELKNLEVQHAFYQHSGTKVVKRHLINGLLINTFGFKTTAEDFLYCFEVFLKAKTYYFFPKSYYVALIHQSSVTQNSENYSKLNNQPPFLKVLSRLLDCYKPSKNVIHNLKIFLFKITVDNYFQSYLLGHNKKIEKDLILNSYKNLPFMNKKDLDLLDSVFSSFLFCLIQYAKEKGYFFTFIFVIKFLLSKRFKEMRLK